MRKLWNRPDMSVWSLVTLDKSGQPNFNICTYVTSVSMTPKLMLVAVYDGTKTLANIKANPTAPVLLQLLSQDLAPVVRVCGQMSGHGIDKYKRLAKRYELKDYKGLPYFAEAAGFMVLKPQSLTEVAGDHELLVGEVVYAKNIHDVPILTTDYLKEKKFIR